MGDLNKMSSLEAWHSDKFRALRRANLAEDVRGTVCEKCLAYEEGAPERGAGASLLAVGM
jgi:hypothetical protein